MIFENLINQRFERLLVLKRGENNSDGRIRWWCKCDCGNELLIMSSILKKQKSCGCIQKEERRKVLLLERFNKLFVEEFLYESKGRLYWKCLCDCGNTRTVQTSDLKNGKIDSCGCDNLNIKPFGEANAKSLYIAYRNNSKRRNLIFDLSFEKFKILTKQDCYYCGVEPKQILKNKQSNGEYIYNGVDRVDNMLGYTVENSIPCCGFCNRSKNTMSQDDFIKWIYKIYNNIKDKVIINETSKL